MKREMVEQGQALITLLFFTIIGIMVTSAAAVMILVNSMSGTKLQQGMLAYQVAQSGAENALLRLLRNPSYTGETLTVGSGTATIQVSPGNGNTYTVTSVGKVGNFTRTVQVTLEYVNNVLSVTSQTEVP